MPIAALEVSVGRVSLKNILEVLQPISLIVGIVFICYQARSMAQTSSDTQKVNSATFVMKISEEVSNRKYFKLAFEIEEHDNNHKILASKTTKGFSTRHLEDYIGIFDTLGNFVSDGVVTKEMAYNALSYEVEKAWCNEDVKRHVHELRKSDKAKSALNEYYRDFETLADSFLKRDGYKCADLDK
jgi:hypothetical protein